MVVQNPWRKHYQGCFRELSTDPDRPLWDRLAFLAYGSARANGHANFKPGQLAEIFDVPAKRISEALARCRDKGLLAHNSIPTCLVVPAHIAQGGVGDEYEPCGVHTGRRIGRQRLTLGTEPVTMKQPETVGR